MDGSLGRIWLRWVVLIVLGTGCRQNSLTEAWTKARASSCEVRVGYSLKDFSIEPDGDDSSYGTCVVWRGDWVVTARHVVKNLDRVFIVDANGVVHRPDLLVRDPFADIAVIRVPGLDAPAVTLSREKLAVGQSVFAVGFARGFTMSMSAGIISGLHLASVEGLNDSIQIDAQLNGGNSGGGVFDARGDLIAIANQSLVKADSTPGISWAIELSIVEFSANAMIEKGAVSYSVPIQSSGEWACARTSRCRPEVHGGEAQEGGA